MRYDLASSSWRTCEATSLWDLEMSSPTFPEWGMTRGGELFPLVRPEPPTGELASSLLPTPISRDVKEQTLGWTWQRDGVTQEDTLPRALTALLPTPVADHSRGLAQPGTDFQSLPNVALSLLPTPRAQLGEERNQNIWERPPDQPQNLENALALLQTPKAGDGERGRDLPWMREDTKSRELATAAGSIGASTPQPSTDGSASSDEPHPAPPSPARPDDHDCLPLSWNG